MSELNPKCAKTFKHFVEVSSVGQKLSEADKKEIKDKGMNKMLKECCDDAVAKASESQVFPKFCDKKTKKLALAVFLGAFLEDLAAAVIQNKRKLAKRPNADDKEVVELLQEIRTQIAAKCDTKTKEIKVDKTTSRLTDTKSYTGTHKERFDDHGKGKGIEGRKDVVDGSGYVTGFKGPHGATGGSGASS